MPDHFTSEIPNSLHCSACQRFLDEHCETLYDCSACYECATIGGVFIPLGDTNNDRDTVLDNEDCTNCPVEARCPLATGEMNVHAGFIRSVEPVYDSHDCNWAFPCPKEVGLQGTCAGCPFAAEQST